jgi:hypothetical protein
MGNPILVHPSLTFPFSKSDDIFYVVIDLLKATGILE